MRKARLISAILAALLLAGCTAKRHTGDITVAEVFAHPWDFNGKRIALIGYYASGMEESALYAGHEYYIAENSAWIDLGWRRAYLKRLANRYVRVVGTFHYRPEVRHEILKRPDGREFESDTPLGFGHMGLYPAELSDITSLRPLR